MKVRLVVASRKNENEFYSASATGRSLALYKALPVDLRLFPTNRVGLPEVYNIAIEESVNDPAVLVFAHDDLHILDFFWVDRLVHALEQFQIVGLAGNKRRVAKQPSWAFVDDQLTWDKQENLSGAVGHGSAFPPGNISYFGPAQQEVKLLDGLLLGCHSSTLVSSNLRFDERFDFDFYDMDFCRQAEAKGLSMGTCALSVIHESGGKFGSEQWRQSYYVYLDKWGT